MHKILLASAVLFLLGTGVVACHEGPPAPDEESRLPGVERIPGGLRMTESALAAPGFTLSNYERQLMDDKVLTLAEYEAAFLESIRCAEGLGYQVSDVRPPTLKRTGTFGAYLPPPANPAASAQFASCKTNFSTGLSALWAAVYGPDDRELQSARSALGACLRERGEEIAESPGPDEVTAYLASAGSVMPFGDCLREVEAQFGFTPG